MSTSASKQNIVIVGAGQAGGEAALTLRKLGFDGRLMIVGDEAYPPYRRPPLSKAYLAGDASTASLYLAAPERLEQLGIEVVTGQHVEHIDRGERSLELSGGDRLAYDKLLLATGGRARMLNLPGAERGNVLPLRSIADVERIREQCVSGRHVTIIGGGFIGLEVAAVAIKMGLRVTVLEGLPRVLARVTAPPVSEFFERLHRDAGVDLRTGAQVVALEGDPLVRRIDLGDGTHVDTDFVVVGIGLIPNTEVAEAAGLKVDNGIVVDEYTRSSDPDIFAAGDCANLPSALFGRRIRLESVQNAMEQSRAAAANMIGREQAYNVVPWFWSDQYDVKLQMAGLSAGYDQTVMRGDPGQRSFAAFYLRDGRLLAADTVGRPQDFMMAKKLVAAAVQPDAEQLADESVPLKTLLPAA